MDLQKGCQLRTINGWQVSFNEEYVFQPKENTSTIPELLNGFFNFYAKLNYKSLVICPLDGNAWGRDSFKHVEDLPVCMDKYKEYAQDENFVGLDLSSTMCVQDPIELNRNVTGICGARGINIFQKNCVLGAKKCASTSKNNFKDLLTYLFLRVPAIEIVVKKFLKAGLPEDFDTRTDITDREEFVKENWYFTVFNIVKDILEKVFKTNVDILSADKEGKQQKIETLSDVHTQNHQKIILHCTGTYNIWRHRGKHTIQSDVHMSTLDIEALISDQMVEKLKKERDSIIPLEFICKLEKKQNPVEVLLTISDHNSNPQTLREFTEFSKSKFIKIIHGTLAHMQLKHSDKRCS